MSQIINISSYCHYFWSSLKNDKRVLYKYQSGFRSNHSADLILSFFSDKILEDFDSVMQTGMILINLQKGFDTINHNVLLEKILPRDFSNNMVNWYESYLA